MSNKKSYPLLIINGQQMRYVPYEVMRKRFLKIIKEIEADKRSNLNQSVMGRR